MENIKILWYCTKARKQLFYDTISKKYMYGVNGKKDKFKSLNGYIVAESDFKVEKLINVSNEVLRSDGLTELSQVTITPTMCQDSLLKKSCLSKYEFISYLKNGFTKQGKPEGYAIHIKNLEVLKIKRDIGRYATKVITAKGKTYEHYALYVLKRAPQSMQYVYNSKGEKFILISVQPQWLCKILNGEKTIEIRKKVLKEMLK